MFKDVPIYFWDPELGYPPLYQSVFGKGTLKGAKFGWYDGEDWIKGTAQGQPVWEIEILQWIEDRSNYKDSPFIVNFNYAPFYFLDDGVSSSTVTGSNSLVNSYPSPFLSKATNSSNFFQKIQPTGSRLPYLFPSLSGPRYENEDLIETFANPQLIQISGRVTVSSLLEGQASQTGISGVVMSGLPDDPLTDDEGKYSAQVEADWTGDVISTKAGYFFSPSYREYSEILEDQLDQDYMAVTMVPITTNRPRISRDYTPNVIIKYPDGETASLDNVGDFTFSLSNDSEIRIPNEKLQKEKPFTIEATHEDANYVGVAKFEFIPVRKLKWKEK